MSERYLHLAASVAKKTVLSTLVVESILLPVKNLDVSAKVLAVLAGERISYSSSEMVNGVPSHDIVVVLGAGSYSDEEGNPKPNAFEKWRLIGAALVIANTPGARVLLLDGDQKVGEVDRQYLEDMVQTFSYGRIKLSNKEVYIGTGFVNTPTSLEYARNFFKNNHFKHPLFMSDDFHIDRVGIESYNFGIEGFSTFTTEQAVGLFLPEAMPMLRKRNENPGMLELKLKETLELIELMYDRDDHVSTLLRHGP